MTNAKYEKFVKDQYDELKRTNYMPHFRVLGGPNSAKTTLDGQEILILCANNYLGLANHPEMKQAATEAIEKWGAGMGTGRMIMTMAIQDELEKRAAEFKSTEAALVYPTGYTANVGAVWSLMAEGDTIVSDELNHASIIDGCRLARGTDRLIYKHLDMADLEKKLKDLVHLRRVESHQRHRCFGRRLLLEYQEIYLQSYYLLRNHSFLEQDHKAHEHMHIQLLRH